jgi:hypothetical protein
MITYQKANLIKDSDHIKCLCGKVSDVRAPSTSYLMIPPLDFGVNNRIKAYVIEK